MRSVWNIPISYAQDDFYFEEFYFADWGYILNIQNTDNLFVTSFYWTFSPTHHIHLIQSAITNPFSDYT